MSRMYRREERETTQGMTSQLLGSIWMMYNKDSCLIKQPPYHLPHAYHEQVQEQLEMLESGIIDESTSEWASPIVIVHKKDRTLRLGVDY